MMIGQTKITKEGSTLGTAAYMSPEQSQGVDVKSLIIGSMALLEDKVVVNFQIVNGKDNSILWGDKLFCQKTSVYEIEEQITKGIVKKSGVRLNKNEKIRTTKRYTENVEAYNLYKKGRYFWYSAFSTFL